jgi:hypothetical protein
MHEQRNPRTLDFARSVRVPATGSMLRAGGGTRGWSRTGIDFLISGLDRALAQAASVWLCRSQALANPASERTHAMVARPREVGRGRGGQCVRRSHLANTRREGEESPRARRRWSRFRLQLARTPFRVGDLHHPLELFAELHAAVEEGPRWAKGTRAAAEVRFVPVDMGTARGLNQADSPRDRPATTRHKQRPTRALACTRTRTFYLSF